MGLISAVLGAPFAPVRGVIRLGELIQERVEQKLHDPAEARRELEAIDAAADAGELTPDEQEAAQQEVVNRMTDQPVVTETPPANPETDQEE